MDFKRPPYLPFAAPLIGVVLLCAAALTCLSGTRAAASPTSHSNRHAFAARTLYVNETSHLSLVSHHGTQVLNEHGSSSGAPGGALTIHVDIAYTQATITFTAYPSGGTLSGQGEATYYAEGPLAHFTGNVKVTHGSGRYAHASASNLKIEGKLERNRNYALYVRVTGQMHY